MNQEDKEYWETDEFEDLVTRSLIGLYETKIKRQRGVPKAIRFDEETLIRFRKMGCYFAPGDREFYFSMKPGTSNDDIHFAATQEIDMINDGIPEKATMNFQPDINGSYLWGFYIERIPKRPKPFKSDIGGKFYRITQLDFANEHVYGSGTILVANKQGILQSCYLEGRFEDPGTGMAVYLKKHRPIQDKPSEATDDYYCTWGAMTIQCYQDRRYLWNVQAYDGTAKATFGVYPEQIKSLFYARDLPQTDTGRKRPILHWVQAHQRRMKSGTEVDVEQYLRGTHEFVMNDTKFRIVNPLKETKEKLNHG